MILYKIKFHVSSSIKKFILTLYHGKKLKIGQGTTWRRRFDLWIERDANLQIGRSCFFNNDCSITCFGSITIGDNTIFGENVKIYDHNHKFTDSSVPVIEQGFKIGTVYIGNNCWIGSNVVILKGANIGDNCVIGAGVVVSESIPDGFVIKNQISIREKIRYE